MSDKKQPKKPKKPSDGHYISPGVYVEEVPSGGKPIEGVGTAIAAFVGLAPFNPMRLATTAIVVAGTIAAVKRVSAAG